ncbi:MAG TPA: phosphoglucosamine mutase, partial [Thermoplasmata archaeon]|nr:phosphoglucosamine mutase [Thermoplasmata archaeon]
VPRAVEEAIEARVAAGVGSSAPFDRVGEVTQDHGGASRYVEAILERVDRAAIARRKFTVVLDCGNGASVVTSPELLRRLGCRLVTLNGHLDGTFPGRLSEPVEANLGDLKRAVPSLGADLGIAHDGDADRAVFVDAAGRYVPGEKVLTLLARDRVRRKPGSVVVTPVSGTQAIEEAIRPYSGLVVYTRVGSPSVTREMQGRSAAFGGEENGGLIFPELQLARDGAMAAAAVLDYLAREDKTLADAIDDLPRFTMVKRNVECPVALRSQVLDRIASSFRGSGARVVTLDGLKVFEEKGWTLLRPSGTEPLVRVFAESPDPADAAALAERGIERVRQALREISA